MKKGGSIPKKYIIGFFVVIALVLIISMMNNPIKIKLFESKIYGMMGRLYTSLEIDSEDICESLFDGAICNGKGVCIDDECTECDPSCDEECQRCVLEETESNTGYGEKKVVCENRDEGNHCGMSDMAFTGACKDGSCKECDPVCNECQECLYIFDREDIDYKEVVCKSKENGGDCDDDNGVCITGECETCDPECDVDCQTCELKIEPGPRYSAECENVNGHCESDGYDSSCFEGDCLKCEPSCDSQCEKCYDNRPQFEIECLLIGEGNFCITSDTKSGICTDDGDGGGECVENW